MACLVGRSKILFNLSLILFFNVDIGLSSTFCDLDEFDFKDEEGEGKSINYY